MEYYERVRLLREDAGLSQKTIAGVLGVAQRTYSDYESGRTRIPVERLITLAQYYGVSMDYITGASDTKGMYPHF